MANNVDHSFLRSNLPAKRNFLTVDQELEGSNADVEMQMSCSITRRRVMHTGKYIYKTLFEESQGSNVRITALGRTWHLHRLYLLQSPYFNSMFNDIEDETTQKVINIGIEDANITTEALHKVFGSLYQDEIHIEPLEAVSILASASLLLLDDLILQSIEVMKDSVNMDTVLAYYEASKVYELKELKYSAMEWFKKNNLRCMVTSPAYLKQISCELMVEFISSPQLLDVSSEFCRYRLLKKWLFVKVNADFGNCDKYFQPADDYFDAYSGNLPFLSTNTGSPYQNAFRALRLKDLVICNLDVNAIKTDRIIPVDWFTPLCEMPNSDDFDFSYDEEAMKAMIEVPESILQLISPENVIQSTSSFAYLQDNLLQPFSSMKLAVELAERTAKRKIKAAGDAKTLAELARKTANDRELANQECPLFGSDTSFHQYLVNSLNSMKHMADLLEQAAVNQQQAAEQAIQHAADLKRSADTIRQTFEDGLKDL